MDYRFDLSIAEKYKSGAQRIRVMSENWVGNNIFCPCCGNPRISRLQNNKPVADFLCDNCGEIFELKSKCGALGSKITDGAYSAMIDRITGSSNPDLFVLQYSEKYEVENLFVIPKFFFVPSIIEKRAPLSCGARRAGWTGCNILISQVPYQGKISIIENERIRDIDEVVKDYGNVKGLQTDKIEKRGWLLDVLTCINGIQGAVFTLKDIYAYKDVLKEKHNANNNIEAKIRQQLQILRDKNIIGFEGNGVYRKKI